MKTGFWHFLAHLFGLNACAVVHEKIDGDLWASLVCKTCGSRSRLYRCDIYYCNHPSNPLEAKS